VIKLVPSDSLAASFEIGDLDIQEVKDAAGPLHYAVAEGKSRRLDVGVPAGPNPEVTVEYAFKAHSNFDGWLPDTGVSFLWPYSCGTLFPCHSDPADGLRFSLAVRGIGPGLTGVFPKIIPGDAPSYMIALAVNDYQKLDLGKTAAGTRVSV